MITEKNLNLIWNFNFAAKPYSLINLHIRVTVFIIILNLNSNSDDSLQSQSSGLRRLSLTAIDQIQLIYAISDEIRYGLIKAAEQVILLWGGEGWCFTNCTLNDVERLEWSWKARLVLSLTRIFCTIIPYYELSFSRCFEITICNHSRGSDALNEHRFLRTV